MSELPPEQPLLPRRGRGDKPLLVIMGVMAALAGLALLTALVALRLGGDWRDDLRGQATLQIMDDTPVSRIITLLDTAAPEVRGTEISDGDLQALLEPWLGGTELPDDMPLPRLVGLSGNVDADRLTESLAASGVAVQVDTHARWTARLSRTVGWVQAGSWLILLVVLGAGAAAGVFATEAALRAESRIIRVLGQVGARDGFVARLFTTRFGILGAKAGAIGAAGAMVFAVLFGVLFGRLGPGLAEIVWLVLLPLIFAGIAAMAARLTTLRILETERRLK